MTTATKVSIKPLEDRVVVQANEAETTTASGLVIPDTAKEKPQEGTVIAVGPGRIDDNGNRVPLDVNVGDVVVYSKYGGTEVRYAGEDYLVLSARDLLASSSSELSSPATPRSTEPPRATRAPPGPGAVRVPPPEPEIERSPCPRSSTSTRTPVAASSAVSTSSPTPSA